MPKQLRCYQCLLKIQPFETPVLHKSPRSRRNIKLHHGCMADFHAGHKRGDIPLALKAAWDHAAEISNLNSVLKGGLRTPLPLKQVEPDFMIDDLSELNAQYEMEVA